MMYVCLHGLRAYISGVRPGYAGNDFRYDSFPRVLEREITPPEFDLSAAFDTLVRLSYRTRYRCPDPAELARIHPQAVQAYEVILARLEALGIHL